MGYTFSALKEPSAGSAGAEAFGINSAGEIVGSYFTSTSGHGFVFNGGSVFKTIDDPAALKGTTGPNAINAFGEVVGSFFGSGVNSGSHGFLYNNNNNTWSQIDDPSAQSPDGFSPATTNANGINDAGDIVGYYTTSGNFDDAFLLSKGTYTTLTDPSGVSTIANGINNSGEIVGEYGDFSSTHGFLYNPNAAPAAQWTTLDFPGSTDTQAEGINDLGQIVGFYYDNSGIFHGFLYDDGTYTSFDYLTPSKGTYLGTFFSGINNAGAIVGANQFSGGGGDNAFVAIPDLPIKVEFGGPLTEGTSDTLTITLAKAPKSDETIDLTVTPGTEPGQDIVGIPTSVDVKAGQTKVTETVDIKATTVSLTLGAKVNLDGDITVLFGAPTNVAQGASALATAPRSGAFATGPLSSQPAANYLFLTVNWTNSAGSEPLLAVTSGGSQILEKDFTPNGIAVVSALSTPFSETVVIQNPGATAWSLEVVDSSGAVNSSGLGMLTFTSASPALAPSISSFSAGRVNSDGTLTVDYNVANAGSATISFFADRDGQNFDGVLLGTLSGLADRSATTSVSLASLSGGFWHVYALISDGANIPQEIYASAGVLINAGGSGAQVLTPVVVSGGHTLTVSAGHVSAGVEILSGGTLKVLAGGTGILESGGQISAIGSSFFVASGGTFEYVGVTVNSAGLNATIGSGATVQFASGASFSGGTAHGVTLEVLSGATDFGSTVFPSATLLEVFAGGLASDAVISSGGREIVFAGGTDVGTTIASGGTEIVSAGGTSIVTTSIASGGMLETLSGGTAVVSGTIVNSGTLIASGPGSLVEIASGGVVAGGAVKIGNGVVDVRSGGTANVAFLSTGSGGLEVADTVANPNAFSGRVSGFGGASHTNHAQLIDLVGVAFHSGQITSSYSSAGGSGTLTVSSGGHVVAIIEFVGNYSAGNFHITAGVSGGVKITDPGVVNGGSVVIGNAQAFPQQGIDLPDITFGAQTTLAYAENRAGSGGMLAVTDGRHAAAIALLGNYMAGSFVAAADGHGGTLVTHTQTGPTPLLSHPQA